jgi:hypothetical protein
VEWVDGMAADHGVDSPFYICWVLGARSIHRHDGAQPPITGIDVVRHGTNKTVVAVVQGPVVREFVALAASQLGKGPAVIDPKLCLVVDVFRETIYTARSGRTRMMGEIRSACREFARTWRDLQEAA